MAEEPTFNGRTAPQLASDAEDSIRGIVHLVEAEERPIEPESVYQTLSGLTRVVEQLPEAIARLNELVGHWVADDQLEITTGTFRGDPEGARDAVQQAVKDEILPAVGRLRTGLDHAQAALGNAHRHAGGPSDV